jgi:hypothetical protein
LRNNKDGLERRVKDMDRYVKELESKIGGVDGK